MFQHLVSIGITSVSLLAAACQAPQNEVERGSGQPGKTAPAEEKAMRANEGPVSERFATLDEYLDWLRLTQAPVDGPWYEEVRPGVYQLKTGNLRVLAPEGEATPATQTFTREELERKFGFRN